MPRDPEDLISGVARIAGAGLMLALPLAALGILRQFPPLTLDPTASSGWIVPVGTAVLAAVAALSAIPALWWVIRSGRWAGASSGSGWLALAATAAVIALSGVGASSSFPGPILGVGVVAAAIGWLATTAVGRARLHGPARWWAALGLPLVAELALVGAQFAPSSDAVTAAAPWMFGSATIVAAAGAVVALVRRASPTAGWILAVAAAILAIARPGSADGLIGLGMLALVPPVTLALLLRSDRRAPASVQAESAIPDLGRERLEREARALSTELADVRRMVELQRAELERTAAVDPLTGIASRASIMDRLRFEVAEARRYPHPVTLVLVDVDGMGELNSRLGTSTGDEVLREMALRLRVRIREADALGRIDGDAFLAVLPHTDEAGAATFAGIIRDRAVQRPIRTSAGEVTVQVSVGVALMRPGMDLTSDALLARADEALASARAAGGNVIAFDRLHGLARLDEHRKEPETTEPERPRIVDSED
jgi:diguanylate cyclase (GGDEF)-like protein